MVLKIKLLDKVLEQDGLDTAKIYEVVRTEVIHDDVYYIVMNENGEEYGVIDLLAEVL